MINQAILLGRITYDLELKHTPNGASVINNVLAVKRSRKNETGEYDADFIPFVVWGQSAEYLEKYARKGDLISIVGSIRQESYENSTGDKVKNYYVKADNVSIESSKPKDTYSDGDLKF